MKILRSILAILVGASLALITVGIGMLLVTLIFPKAVVLWDRETQHELHAEPEKVNQAMDAVPTGAFIGVLITWAAGAFLGAWAAALLAGRRPMLHAGIIGGVVLVNSALAMMMMPYPDWMKFAGLLLPLPVSLSAGKVVSLLYNRG